MTVNQKSPALSLIAFLALALFFSLVGSAAAGAAGTGWGVFAQSYPTSLRPGGKGILRIDLINVGASPSGGPIVLTDTLPAGMVATAAGEMTVNKLAGGRWECAGVGTGVVSCTSSSEQPPEIPSPGGVEEVGVEVEVRGAGEGSFENVVSVAGGGGGGSDAGHGLVDGEAPRKRGLGFRGGMCGSAMRKGAFRRRRVRIRIS